MRQRERASLNSTLTPVCLSFHSSHTLAATPQPHVSGAERRVKPPTLGARCPGPAESRMHLHKFWGPGSPVFYVCAAVLFQGRREGVGTSLCCLIEYGALLRVVLYSAWCV